MEAHDHNITKNEVVNSWTVRIEDRGEYLWLEEIQVHPEKRRGSTERCPLVPTIRNAVPPRTRIRKKPIRTLARVVEGIPQEELVKTLKRMTSKSWRRSMAES